MGVKPWGSLKNKSWSYGILCVCVCVLTVVCVHAHTKQSPYICSGDSNSNEKGKSYKFHCDDFDLGLRILKYLIWECLVLK